jgi:hypothetical protein
MNEYNIITNPIEFISGTTNTTHPLYVEAVKDIESGTPKAMGYLKNFLTSIESVASKNNMRNGDNISRSKGNIQKFSGYNNIKVGLNFLTSHLPGAEIVKNIKTIVGALETCSTQYIEAYNKNVRLITLEYEASLYMVVTGISFAMASYTDIQQNGAIVKVIKKPGGKDKGVIAKTISEMAKELITKDHKKYLEELLRIKDNAPTSTKLEAVSFTEASIMDSIELVKMIGTGIGKTFIAGRSAAKILYRTMFGILPLIQSALYLKYKRKADSIISLDEQIQFIEMNIDQLKNIKTMDETKKAEIIKKQQAVIEAYRKKSEKLRAELTETEKDAADAINQDSSEVKKDTSDDFIFD